jgi:hypothetical protein
MTRLRVNLMMTRPCVNPCQPVSLSCHCVFVTVSCECVLWVEVLLSVSCECRESRCWREQLFEGYSLLRTHRLQQVAQRHTDSNSLPRERATPCLRQQTSFA